MEELPEKHLIGNFFTNGLSSPDTDYQFSLISPTKAILDLFEIGRHKGELRTKIKIDRDSLCDRKSLCCNTVLYKDCELSFKVVIKGIGSESLHKYFRVRVIIEDKNDNSPKFLHSVVSIDVSESVAVGTILRLPTAIDEDSGKNTIQTYTLEKSTTVFRLITVQTDGMIYPRLEVTDLLDRETIYEYQLVLCARDGGTPMLKGCTKLIIKVTDANDNNPTINQASLSFRVPESLRPGEIIGTIKAKDKDVGENGILKYGISDLAPLNIRSTFAIDSGTGDIKLLQKIRQPLFSGIQNQISFPIFVSDSGIPSLTTTGTVTVHIQDTNDEPPIITITDLQGNSPPKPSILENLPPGQVVAFIHVTDADKGENGQVECSIDENMTFRLILDSGNKESQSKEYKLESSQMLDREDRPFHQLRIVCKDKGIPSKSTVEQIVVHIIDENDNYPVFHPNPIILTIQENLPAKSLIAHLNVTDIDDNSSGSPPVTCQLELGVYDYLEIDSNMCTLYTRQVLDREIIDKFSVHVVATDRGIPPKKTTATVSIQVEDQNDNKPQFSKPLYEFHLKEKLEPFVFAKLVAQDPDLKENGEVTYRINYHDNAAQVAFQIEETTGNLHSKISLDREKRSSYSFEVMAIDNGRNPLSSSTSVKIIVDDVNDNSPKFIYPSHENRSHVYSLYSEKGTPLIKVTATDIDEGTNKDITYEIISDRQHNGLFQLDPTTGQLYLARDLEKADEGTHTVKIEARDNGEPPLRDIGFLKLTFDSTVKVSRPFNIKRNPPNGPEQDQESSIFFGRNIILIICVIFVALLAIIVFIFMVYFLKRKQYLNSDSVVENEYETGSKRDPALFGQIPPDQINITNNNLWNHCSGVYNTLQISSLSRQDDKYLPLSPVLAVNMNEGTNNYYQSLIKENDPVNSKLFDSVNYSSPEIGKEVSFCIGNKKRSKESVSDALILSTAGMPLIKNRNTPLSMESNCQQSSMKTTTGTTQKEQFLSSTFV